jgi:hypothetical protein
MLAYGIAVSAVGLFSQREVGRLGAAFLVTGVIGFALVNLSLGLDAGGVGLILTALSFGGYHMAYGLTVARRGGW